MATYPISDHFDGQRFFVPGHDGDKRRRDLLKWTLTEKRARWPRQLPSEFDGTPEPRIQHGIRSTLIGHASFLLQVAGLNILIDPVYGKRASPVQFAGPKRVNPPGVTFENLPDIDLVLVTHNHYDHLDKPNLWRVEQRWQPHFICPLGVDQNLKRSRKMPGNITTLDWGQNATFAGVTIHAVPTYHWSARSLGDRRKSLWCSFVLTTHAGTIYHIGDTGYGAGQFSKDVARDFGAITLAHIPIGAYAPRWFMKDHHVNPEEAVQIMQDCGAQHAIGHHWGTFQLTNEPHNEPEQLLTQALVNARISPMRFQAFRPGQVWRFD